MSLLHERLKQERIRLNHTQVSFAALGGVKKNAQRQYENGERSPNADYLIKIGEIGANVPYILYGTINSVPVEGDLASSSGITNELIEIPCYGHVTDTHHAKDSPKSYWFPREWFVSRHLPEKNIVLVDMAGDSMLPHLRNKDLVFVDTSKKTIGKGQTFAVRMDNNVLVNNFQFIAKKILQVSGFNSAYPLYTIDLSDESLVMEIIGQVITSVHQW